jgi:hypothetical protein
MKKIYVLAAFLSIGTIGFAQKASTIAKSFPNPKSTQTVEVTATPTDTLWGNFWNGSPTLYSSGSGYVAGNNNYGDKVKAQAFVIPSAYPYAIEEVLIWFGAKQHNSGNPNSKMVVKVQNMNGTGTNNVGTGQPAPGTTIAGSSVDLLLTDVDTTAGNINVIAFPGPIAVAMDYAISVDLTTLSATDTIGIVTTADGDAGGADLSWEQWSDNTWHSFLHTGNWELDIDMAIFPVVDMNAASVEDMGFTNGIKLFQNQPNPFNDVTTVNYELAENNEVTLLVYDLTGKMVAQINAGEQIAGKHSINLNAADFAQGTYYFVLKAGKTGIARKMVITN